MTAEAITTIRERASNGVAAVAAFIERHIADGTWAPGHKLPTERELERRFGIARNTLRRGLRRLEAQGKIVRHVGRGTFVAAPALGSAAPNAALDPLAERIHRASPAEVMEVRLIIEPQVVELAAVRATADDLLAIEECVRRSEAAETIAEFEHWDGQLHRTILAATRNGLLTDLYDALNGVRRRAEWGKLKERTLTPERRQTYQRQHRRLVAALKDRDPDAARAEVRAHLLEVRAALVGG